MENDLQRVPNSWMLMSSAPQVVQTANRTNSMPTWRGYLPMKFEPMTMDQYQMTSHFSQKVFLGGIPAELTEGKSNRTFSLISLFTAELLLVLRKFGKCNIKWPKNDGTSHTMPGSMFVVLISMLIFWLVGFCHVVFRESRSVCELLKHCTRQQRSTIDYFLHIHMTTAPTTSMGLPMQTNRLKPVSISPNRSLILFLHRFKWYHGM